MAEVTELRITLTVQDFDQAVAFYRDALGLEQMADWSSASGRVVALEAGRATLELFDQAQAESVDAVEAGRRVSGTIRFALRVPDSEDMAARLVAAQGLLRIEGEFAEATQGLMNQAERFENVRRTATEELEKKHAFERG